MNPKYHGPAVLPPAAEVRKRVEEHLESLPGWGREARPESAEPRRDEPARPGPDA